MKNCVAPILLWILLGIPLVSAQDAITVYQSGNVGVGTSSEPTERLEVAGRILDKTGYILPVGSIVPFGGTSAPIGWLLCDGLEYSRSRYADLFEVIGTAFGDGDGATTFNVPDLRGVFIRGADGSTGRDPEADFRSSLNGGNAGNSVGSLQRDAFQTHDHKVPAGTGTDSLRFGSAYSYWSKDQNAYVQDVYTSHDNSGVYGSAPGIRSVTGGAAATSDQETRPINVAVSFIIKY